MNDEDDRFEFGPRWNELSFGEKADVLALFVLIPFVLLPFMFYLMSTP